jgi:hypothetical protein
MVGAALQVCSVTGGPRIDAGSLSTGAGWDPGRGNTSCGDALGQNDPAAQWGVISGSRPATSLQLLGARLDR